MSVTFSAYNKATETFSNEDLDVNMNNRNAALVSESLGIDLDADGWCGGTSAADFMGRVLMALALTPTDEGMPSYELSAGQHPFGQARFVEGARPVGYTQERLSQLHELAQWAIENNAEVTWG